MRNTKKYLRKKRFVKTKLRKKRFRRNKTRRRYTTKKGGVSSNKGLFARIKSKYVPSHQDKLDDLKQSQKETAFRVKHEAGLRCLDKHPGFLRSDNAVDAGKNGNGAPRSPSRSPSRSRTSHRRRYTYSSSSDDDSPVSGSAWRRDEGVQTRRRRR